MKKIFLLGLTSLLFFACQTQKPIAGKENVVIKIVQINDVYEIEALNNGKNGGLSRVAYIRDSIHQSFPNTYFFLAGDFLSPSLLSTIKVDGERLQGKQMIEVLNAAKLDLVTFGNHEFDIKENALLDRLNESEFAWTSANVRHVTADGDKPFTITNAKRNEEVSDYKIYSVDDGSGGKVKFGVFGVTLPSNPQAFVYYGDIYDEAVRSYNAAAAESNFVIGLTHVSLDQDMEIARRIPGLRLIMGGHEHFNMVETAGDAVITKADANVLSLFVHTLEYNPVTRNLDIDSELVRVNDRFKSDPNVDKIVERWGNLLDNNLKTIVADPNEVIFVATEPLDGTDTSVRSMQTNLGAIINSSMLMAFNGEADAVLSNGGGIRIDDTLTGELTPKDVFRIWPYPGKALKVEMTGELLKTCLDFGVSASGTGAYLQRLLVEETADKNWIVNGAPLDTGKNYTVVLNDFLLQGLDLPFLTAEHPGILSISQPNEDELGADIRKSIIYYMQGLK